MKIYRTELQDLADERVFRESLADIGIFDLGPSDTPVLVTLVASPQGKDYVLHGQVTAELQIDCDRCLGPARQSISGSFRALLAQEWRPGLGADDIALPVTPAIHPEVDLGGITAEVVYLEAAVKALCRENCRGLCPSCGIDLNQQACDCAGDGPDERWLALHAIKQQLEQ